MENWQERENGIIHKVAGIIVRNQKLLLTRKRGTGLFLSPGGKPRTDENREDALCRELAEETGLITIEFDHFGRFEGISALGSAKIVIDAYRVIVGGDPTPGAEISELIWIGGDHGKIGIEVGSVFRDHVIPELLEAGIVARKSFDPYFAKSETSDGPVFAVIDLDGSIIFKNKSLDPRIAAGIAEMRRSRVQVIFATSRAPRGVRHVLPQTFWEVPTIYCNGALVRSGSKEIFRLPIATTVCREICEYLLSERISFHLEYGDSFSLFGRKEQFPDQLLYNGYQVNPMIVGSTFDGVLKIAVPEEKVVYGMLRLKRHLLQKLHIVSHQSGVVELIVAGADKLSAAKALINNRHSYVMAFVNDYNDFGLLTGCSTTVVVGRRLWCARNLSRAIFIRSNVDDISNEFFRIAAKFTALNRSPRKKSERRVNGC
jgi:hypothetical protein